MVSLTSSTAFNKIFFSKKKSEKISISAVCRGGNGNIVQLNFPDLLVMKKFSCHSKNGREIISSKYLAATARGKSRALRLAKSSIASTLNFYINKLK